MHIDKTANVSAHFYANQAISKYVRKRRAENLFFRPPAKNKEVQVSYSLYLAD